MTAYEPLDRTLATLFAEEAAASAPADLASRILADTARRRPRSGWRARIAQASAGGLLGVRPAGGVAGRGLVSPLAILALLALLAAGTLVVGWALNRQPVPPTLRGAFVPAGSLPVPATTVLLQPGGDVIVIGGRATAAGGLGSLAVQPEPILIYDPATGASREIGSTAASVGTAIPLADGRVLAIELAPSGPGGGSGGQSVAELIDPVGGRVTPLGPTLGSHLNGAGVQLSDGRVLLVGDAAGTTEAERFDPATRTFAATEPTVRPMKQPTATLLADGRVLVVGEWDPVAILFDPVTGTFSETGAMSGPREDFTATLLADGRVLIAGGWATNGTFTDGLFTPAEPARLATTAEVYDPVTGRFSPVGAMVTPRVHHFAVALADGRVLVGGGTSSLQADVGSGGLVDPPAVVAELFDPASGTFIATGEMGIARYGAGAVRLSDGRVLVSGSVHPSGGTDPAAASSLEIFE